jgi:hypothetical protein
VEFSSIVIHAGDDYNRIQDPALRDLSLLRMGCTPIAANEPVFLLRGQDKHAAEVVRYWAALNEKDPDHDPKAVGLARAHANLIDAWPLKKTTDVP